MEQENQSTPEETDIEQNGGTSQNAGQDIGNGDNQECGTLGRNSGNEQSPNESLDDRENTEEINGTSEDERSDASELDIDEGTGNPGLG